jgi:hypothetical protein
MDTPKRVYRLIQLEGDWYWHLDIRRRWVDRSIHGGKRREGNAGNCGGGEMMAACASGSEARCRGVQRSSADT